MQAPTYLDPTYRHPDNAVKALSKPETAIVTEKITDGRRHEILKSKLPEDVKKKLLGQVIL